MATIIKVILIASRLERKVQLVETGRGEGFRFTIDCNLVQGDHVFVFVDSLIQIGKGESLNTSKLILYLIFLVVAMYQKSGGKNAKNEAVTKSSNLSSCALSRISVQVFEYTHGLQFTCKPTTTLLLNAFQFAHLPSYTILTLLTNKPHSINNSGFDISQGDIELYIPSMGT